MDLFDGLKIVGALGTAFGIFWALFTFRRAEDRRTFAGARDQLGVIRSEVSRLDSLLSEPEFSRISSEIVKRIRSLKPEDWELSDFNDFLVSSDADTRNYLAQAIHEGRLASGVIERINEIIRSLRELPNQLKEPFPILEMSLQKLIWYVTESAQGSVSPRLFNIALADPEVIKESLIPELEKHMDHENFYFAELCIYIGQFPSMKLGADRHGQSTLNQARAMISILVDTYSRMNDADLRKSSARQQKAYGKAKGFSHEHAAEDAIAFLQLIRSEFSESDWDKLVECKTRIVSLMGQNQD